MPGNGGTREGETVVKVVSADPLYREKFQVVVAGSNAYTSTVYQSIPDYTGKQHIARYKAASAKLRAGPTFLNNAAINSPDKDCTGGYTYMGFKLFTDGPFDARLCSAACDAQTEYNLAHPPSDGTPPAICTFFNTYLLMKNDIYSQGQHCSMYTQNWGSSYATNTGQYDGNGNHFTIKYSFSYFKASSQPICPSDITYLQNNAQAFCSSYNHYSGQPTTTVTTTSASTSTTTESVTSTLTIQLNKRSARYIPRNARRAAAPAVTTDAVVEKRAVATPASLASWPAARISAGCSKIQNWAVTSTVTADATTVTVTSVVATTTETYGPPQQR